MIEIGYNFAGSLVVLSAAERAHLSGFDTIINRLATATTRDPQFRITVHVAEVVALPEGVTIVQSGPVGNEPSAIYAIQAECRYLLLPDKACLVYDPSAARVDLTVLPDKIACAGDLCGMHAIDIALEATGQLLIHAAALTLPDQSAGLLLYAVSGMGKTTTTLRLVFDGFGVFTDDVAVVRSGARGPEVWGLPRFLKIHKNTAAMDPRYAPLAKGDWDRNDEQVVRLDDLARAGVRVEPAVPTPLAALVCLTRNADTLSRPTEVRPLSRADALCTLTEDNVRSSNQGILKFQAARMMVIANLVRDVATFECRVGSDFENVSERLLTAIANKKSNVTAS
jgi:hypothetical protein